MTKPTQFPEQSQNTQPGNEYMMSPEPEVIRDSYKGSHKLRNKVALITGGDSGIGRAVAVHFAREGAMVAIVYLEEDEDATTTKEMIEQEGTSCLLLEGDIKDPQFCKDLVKQTVEHFGQIDILVNNAGVQFPKNEIEEITPEQLSDTFKTNIFSIFYITQEVVPHLKKGAHIINTTSVTGFRGSPHLLDYSSTKGAITSFTRSLAKNLASKGINVNAVAPGPIWTPLIPSTFDKVSKFGSKTPLGRAGQPSEVAPAYVYLASDDSSYVTGEILHVNGGEFVGG